MADKKISQLTAASTPLAGTEVLPIVQSSTTVKVAIDDLTVKNIRSNATNGLLQIAGPAAAATRIMTVPDANFTVARTDAVNSFTGNQTLGTGNLVIGTSGKGIDFSATAGTGTSELLNDYEEGTWTPVIAGSVTPGTYDLAASISTYTKIGRQVTVSALITTAGSFAGGGTGDFTITGLPFSKSADQRAFAAVAIGGMSYTAGGVVFASFGGSGASSVLYFTLSVSGTGATLLPISLVGGSNFIGFTLSYSA
jgi:hypothetical protein